MAPHPRAARWRRRTQQRVAVDATVSSRPDTRRSFLPASVGASVWASHGTSVSAAPAGFSVVAHERQCGQSGRWARIRRSSLYGPAVPSEVVPTPNTAWRSSRNFAYGVCRLPPATDDGVVCGEATAKIRAQVGNGKGRLRAERRRGFDGGRTDLHRRRRRRQADVHLVDTACCG